MSIYGGEWGGGRKGVKGSGLCSYSMEMNYFLFLLRVYNII